MLPMTATAHAIIGTAIAAKFTNPVIGIPLCLISHVVADALPHWDIATHRREKNTHRLLIESASDVCIGFFLSYLLIHFFFPQTNLTYAFFAILTAQSLDWFTAPYYFGYRIFKPVYTFQKLFDQKLDKPW